MGLGSGTVLNTLARHITHLSNVMGHSVVCYQQDQNIVNGSLLWIYFIWVYMFILEKYVLGQSVQYQLGDPSVLSYL